MGPKSKINKTNQTLPKKSVSKTKKHGKKDEDDLALEEIGEEYRRGKTAVKPPDQLELSEKQLKEEFTRILTTISPKAPDNIVRFNHKDGVYRQLPVVEQITIHFAVDGNLLAKDSDEARRQLARHGSEFEKLRPTTIMECHDPAEGDFALEESTEVDLDVTQDTQEAEEGTEGYGDAAELDDEAAPLNGEKKDSLRNQFNFSDRAAQTYNNPNCSHECQTEAAPREKFSSNANQGEMFDAYDKDLKTEEKSKEKTRSFQKKENEKAKKKQATNEVTIDDISKVYKAAKIIERMVNQNTYDEIAQDFSYFEDESDEYREHEGTLLPLWKFSFEKVARLMVTALCWNSQHLDLFAVGHGSYEFTKQGKGLLLYYSLKNPSHPEYIFQTESGVMSLDFHVQHHYLLCVGYYDGNVAVFNVKDCITGPIAKSVPLKGKHSDPVWQVRWQKDDLENNLNFFSVGSDGKISSWTLIKDELVYKEVMTLVTDRSIDEISDKPLQIKNTGCGTTFDFHKKLDDLFLVGTEEGRIYKCSKKYATRFLGTIEAHHLPVNAVRWNTFHPDVFMTCSADWTVKIWDNNYKDQAMFTFDLDCPVSDVAWAPYSSTVFAAVTTMGKVHVFDLSINKFGPLCQQSVVQKRKTKLTRIEFNSKKMIIIVGDDRGCVTSLKLSPNLRKMPKVKKGQALPVIDPELEIAKLDKILSILREPENREIPSIVAN